MKSPKPHKPKRTKAISPTEVISDALTFEVSPLALNVALEQGDTKLIGSALRDLFQAKVISLLAKDASLSRETVCRALSAEDDMEFVTCLKLVKALGFQLSATYSG